MPYQEGPQDLAEAPELFDGLKRYLAGVSPNNHHWPGGNADWGRTLSYSCHHRAMASATGRRVRFPAAPIGRKSNDEKGRPRATSTSASTCPDRDGIQARITCPSPRNVATMARTNPGRPPPPTSKP